MPKKEIASTQENHKVGQLNREEVIKEKIKDAVKKKLEEAEKRKEVLGKYLGEQDEDEIEESKTFHQKTVEAAMTEILSTENIDMKTDLTKPLILELAKADVMMSVFDLPCLKTFTNSMKIKLVSNNRQGRGEIVKLANSGNSLGEPLEPISNRARQIVDRLGI